VSKVLNDNEHFGCQRETEMISNNDFEENLTKLFIVKMQTYTQFCCALWYCWVCAAL